VLRIPLQLGPGFAGTTARDGARVIISNGVWKRSFNGDGGVIGRAVRLTGIPATIQLLALSSAAFEILEGRWSKGVCPTTVLPRARRSST